MELIDTLLQSYWQKSILEWVAVVLALAYLALAMKESLWCWPAAFISTAIYTWLFWNVSLLMDSCLNVYYMVMAVYGFYFWFYPKKIEDSHIHTWSWKLHLVVVSAVIIVSAISGYLLQSHTTAAWPYLDSFTTWASVVTTFMVARKILENWLYWIVIDSVALVLYIERGLYPTAALFFVYLIMCVFGFVLWQRKYQEQTSDNAKLATALQ